MRDLFYHRKEHNLSIAEMEAKARELRPILALIKENQSFTRKTTTRRFTVA